MSPNPGSSPATPVSPSAAGAAHAAQATKSEQSAKSKKSKQSKKSKKNAKKQRGARRPPGHAEEDPTMQMMGLLADAEMEDDAAALDADSGGCTDADMASDGAIRPL